MSGITYFVKLKESISAMFVTILHSKLQEAGDYNFYTSLHAISRFCSPNLKVIFVGALSKETNIGVSGNIASGNIISDNGMFIH